MSRTPDAAATDAHALAPGRGRQRRRLLLRLLLALGALLVLGVLAAALALQWLLHSDSGRDFALARVAATLEDAGVSFQQVEGTLDGPLTLHGLRADSDAARVLVRSLRLDIAPWSLLSRRLVIEELRAEGVQVQLLPGADAAAEDDVSDTPFALPRLALPVAVELQQATVVGLDVLSAQAQPLVQVQRLQLAAQLGRDGTLAVRGLQLLSDRGNVRGELALQLDGARLGQDAIGEGMLEIIGPAPAAPLARLHLDTRGERSIVTLQLPAEDRVQLQLTGAQWRLDSALRGFDPAAWWPQWEHGAVTLLLDAHGNGATAQLAGEVAAAGEHWRIDASQLTLESGGSSLRADPLLLTRLHEGAVIAQVRLDGVVGLGGGTASALRAQLQQVQLPGDQGGVLAGTLDFDGVPDAYQLAFDGSLVHPDATVAFALAASGDTSALQLQQLRISDGARDTLLANGRVQWSPTMAVELEVLLEGFNPGRLHADFPGALDGRLQLSAARADVATAAAGDASNAAAEWTAALTLQQLRGQLRGRAVSGEGALHWGGAAARTRLQLGIGDSSVRVEGTAGEALDLQLSLAPLVLTDLLPDSAGRVTGSVQVRGAPSAPLLELALEAEGLVLGGQRVGGLSAQGQAATGLDRRSDLLLTARELELGGMAFAAATVQVDGDGAAHRLRLAVQGDALDLSADVQGGWDGDRWQGRIEQLRLVPGERPAWTLGAPAALAYGAQGWMLESTCLADPSGVSLCAQASADADGSQRARLQLQSMPLAALGPLLSANDPVPLQLEGAVSGEAQLQRDASGAIQGQARLSLPAGSAALEAAETRELLAWESVQLQLQVRGGTLALRIDGTLEQTGTLAVQLDGGLPWEPGAPLQGTLRLQLPRLRVLELLTPHVHSPDGVLDAQLRLGGSWEQPSIEGQVAVRELATELPALGIAISDSELVATPAADGSLALRGRVDTGEGTLELSGSMQGRGGDLVAALEIGGERVLVSDTPLARALVSPQLQLDYSAADGVRIEGSVDVVEARLDLERIEGSVGPSADVVVTDPRDEREAGGGMPLRADIALQLGEQVELRGFGFDGQVSGTLAVRERPGRVTTGRGTLDVTGEYTAYGQDLRIVQGRLLFSGTPLDNPALDVRAEREVREQTVGLRIRGSARTPELEIFAEPPLEQAEALSYLVLGRPLNSASSADSGQLSQAAAAIGGNFLAERLGARLGFDTFEVGDSNALGGTAFTVGKYLSPKLYVSYGVALFSEGTILTLRYILSRRFELELESGVENRAGINYTLER